METPEAFIERLCAYRRTLLIWPRHWASSQMATVEQAIARMEQVLARRDLLKLPNNHMLAPNMTAAGIAPIRSRNGG